MRNLRVAPGRNRAARVVPFSENNLDQDIGAPSRSA